MQGQFGKGLKAPWGENDGFTPLSPPTSRNEPTEGQAPRI